MAPLLSSVGLGRSRLTVSRLGLGLAALGRPGYINLGHADDLTRNYEVASMQAGAAAVLDAAWAAGVNYFDAARSYGRAEEFLAAWLRARAIAPEAVTVGSKWGYTYTAGWRTDAAQHEVKEHSLSALERQLAESRAQLGSHLDLYQVHSATLDSGILDDRAVLERLADLRDSGLTIGLTTSGAQQAETLPRALALQVGGAPLFAVVQVTWNLLERSVGPVVAEAHAAGVGVIIKEPLANGRLTERNRAAEFAPQLRRLAGEAERLGCSIDALALAAALARPGVGVVLSGAATLAQLASNLSALHVAWDAAAEHALRDVAETPTAYWATRARLAWN